MKSKSNLICLVILSDKLINKKLYHFEKKMEGYNRPIDLYNIESEEKINKISNFVIK